MGNVYNDLLEIMGGATTIEPSFFIAKVISSLPNLKVSLEGIELDEDDLLIDKWLKDRNGDLFTENEGHSHGGDTTGNGEHRHKIKEPIQDKLETDDKVLLLKVGDKFIVISKVVSL